MNTEPWDDGNRGKFPEAMKLLSDFCHEVKDKADPKNWPPEQKDAHKHFVDMMQHLRTLWKRMKNAATKAEATNALVAAQKAIRGDYENDAFARIHDEIMTTDLKEKDVDKEVKARLEAVEATEEFESSKKRLISMLKRAMGNMKNAKPTQGGVRKHGAGNKAHQGKLFGFHKRASEAATPEEIDGILAELRSAKAARAKLRKTTSVKAAVDTKGAVAFVKKCFDDANIDVKVTGRDEDGFDAQITVSGKVLSEPFKFMLNLDGKDVYFDVFEWPDFTSNFLDIDIDLMDKSVGSKSDVKKILKSCQKVIKDVDLSTEKLAEYSEFLLSFQDAITRLAKGYTRK